MEGHVMGKGKRNKVAKQSDAGTGLQRKRLGPERDLLVAGVALYEPLLWFREAVSKYFNDPDTVLELDDHMLALAHETENLEAGLTDLLAAIEIVEANAPVALLSAQGKAWKGKLNPHWMKYFAGIAAPEDAGYLAQLREVEAKAAARESELSQTCGRPTASGRACEATPVYWPGRGRVAGCNRHMTVDEKTELQASWDSIERKNDCPGCTATAGQACKEDADKLRVVNGDWPRTRSFAGKKMHDVRLQIA